MPKRVVRLGAGIGTDEQSRLEAGIAAIQRELGVSPDFPPEVEAAAAVAAASPRMPDLDRTDIPFVTLDPAGSMDLDQALHIERKQAGFVVHYAIADVAAFVAPGDPIDREAHARGETLYGPDSKVPLHPKSLSEGAASLLPGQVRPALLWTIALDASGAQISGRVERARVRSRAQLTYVGVQSQIDAGRADPQFDLLGEVGRLRLDVEHERGGVSLPLPEQEVRTDAGHWALEYRTQLAVERWNAEISLLTGMTSAALMLEHRVGILRTLPPADKRDLDRLRRTAKALGFDWPGATTYPDFIGSVDPAKPAGAALLVAATRTLRGASYVGFNGRVPDQAFHSALAAAYTHTTAPLRRLVDRYAGEVALSLCQERAVPGWVTEELDTLPELMREAARRAGQYERAILDLVESIVLGEHVGQVYDGVVVSVDDKDPHQGAVMVRDPAVEGPVHAAGVLPLGEAVRVRLARADPDTRQVSFQVA